MKLGVRSIHALVHPKLVKITPVRRVQSAAACVFSGDVVICHALTSQIVIGTLHSPRNPLRAAMISAVLVRSPLVVRQKIRRRNTNANRRRQRGHKHSSYPKTDSQEHPDM